jgi:sialic acid synthase SpsE
MQVIAEVGSGFIPGKFPLESAIKAAMDCGADLCKIQFWSSGAQLAMRRGGAKGLEQWQLRPSYVVELAEKLAAEYKRPVLGASIFHPDDVRRLELATINSRKIPLALVKSATQEYQYAALAEALSAFSTSQEVPLIVSVPRDGCLVVGNYHSPQPTTWLYAEPSYPAAVSQYDPTRIPHMRQRLPGKFGLSDHTPNCALLRKFVDLENGFTEYVLDCVERHFLYDEYLRGQVPDGGPWSLSRADFKEYVKIAHSGDGA